MRLFASLLLVLLSLVACSDYRQPLRVAASPWPSAEPLYLAAQLNLFRGQPPHLQHQSSPSHVMNALQNAQTDVAFLGLDEAITLRARGVPIKVIAIVDEAVNAHVLIKHQQAPLDFRRWRIGFENNGTDALILAEWLDQQGLAVQDMALVEAKLDEHLRLFRRGQLDALVTRQPQVEQLEDIAQVVFDASELPFGLFTVVVAREEVLVERSDQVAQALSGYYKARQFYTQRPQRASQIMAQRNQLFIKDFRVAMNSVRLIDPVEALIQMKGHSGNFGIQVNGMAHQMVNLGMLQQQPQLDGLVDSRWLEQVLDDQ